MATLQPSGSWQGSYIDIEGKRRKKNFSTEKQAEAWERAGYVARDNIRAGLAPAPVVKRPLSQLWPAWLARRPPMRQRDDLSRWTNHVGPFLGNDDIDSIDEARLADFVRHMETKTSARPGQISKKPLGANTIKNCLVLIGKFVFDVTKRRVTYRYKVPTSGYAWLEGTEDVAKFLAACNAEWFRVTCALALYAGLRKGEIAGLRKKAISFDLETIEVSWSYDGPVKSKHHRYVPLAPELAKILKPWVEKLAPDELLIKIDGKMMDPDYDIAKKARKTAKRAGTASINFHQTRHTFASHLAKTQPLTVVGALCGHVDPKTTQRYAHVNKESLARNPAVHLSFTPAKKTRRKPQRSAT